MSKIKKYLIYIVVIISVAIIFGGVIYFFNQAQKQILKEKSPAELLADLETAKQKLAAETTRLREIRAGSYLISVSEAEYEKAKNLVTKTNIFFLNPEGSRPEIQLKINNKIIATEINNRRAKINEMLKAWSENDQSLETDLKLLEDIKTYLIIIQVYLDQLESVVADLSTNDSGLTAGQIDSYTTIVRDGSEEIKNIIETIKETASIITGPTTSTSSQNSSEISAQAEIIAETTNEIIHLEDQLYNPPTDTSKTSPTSTPLQDETTTNPLPSTSTESETIITRIINPQNSSIIYRSNPRPYRDNGVDIDSTGKTVPLQDW